MTLPFASENGRQSFKCFVCGVMFEDFEEFKSHIKQTHREGDDFIVCPLLRCQAPVRDLRAHFQAKHPGEKMPQHGQMKAIIWKDFVGGKPKTRKPKFKEGWHESTKMRRTFRYRSGYEKTVYECLDALPDVIGYDAEPFRIPYIHEGKEHEYIPDIIVTFNDSHREVWEIKPANQTKLEINRNKWTAANLECAARGWQFIVITEQGIEKLKKRVRMLYG
jgi:hypothetical protein